MEKPHYPTWMRISLVIICLYYVFIIRAQLAELTAAPIDAIYVWVVPVISAFIFLFGLLSATYILRQKEALYLMVLLSFMFLFFLGVFMLVQNNLPIIETILFIVEDLFFTLWVVIILHLFILRKLSYMCFGAVVGGGNYKKK